MRKESAQHDPVQHCSVNNWGGELTVAGGLTMRTFFIRENTSLFDSQEPSSNRRLAVLSGLRTVPSEGDWVIFGRALADGNIWFREVSEITSVQPSASQQESRDYAFELRRLAELPPNRTLKTLMFSLERVYNFSRPTSHFRSGSVISPTDLCTIVLGRVHVLRTVYYGLLHRLPQRWRSTLMAQSEVQRRHGNYLDLEVPPAQELVRLLEQQIRPLIEWTPRVLGLWIQLRHAGVFEDRTELAVGIPTASGSTTIHSLQPLFDEVQIWADLIVSGLTQAENVIDSGRRWVYLEEEREYGQNEFIALQSLLLDLLGGKEPQPRWQPPRWL